jgi:hypothetical protein
MSGYGDMDRGDERGIVEDDDARDTGTMISVDRVDYASHVMTLLGEVDRYVTRESFDPKEMAKVLLRHRATLSSSKKKHTFDHCVVTSIVICLKMGTKQLKKKLGETLVAKLEKDLSALLLNCEYKGVGVEYTAEGKHSSSRKPSDLSVSRLLACFPHLATYAMYGALYFGPIGHSFIESPNATVLIPRRFAVAHLKALESFYQMVLSADAKFSVVVIKSLITTLAIEEDFREAFRLGGERCSPALFIGCTTLAAMIKAIQDADVAESKSQEVYDMPKSITYRKVSMTLGGTLSEVVDFAFSESAPDEDDEVEDFKAQEIESDEGGIAALVGASHRVVQDECLYFFVESDFCMIPVKEVDADVYQALLNIKTYRLTQKAIAARLEAEDLEE